LIALRQYNGSNDMFNLYNVLFINFCYKVIVPMASSVVINTLFGTLEDFNLSGMLLKTHLFSEI